MNKLFCAVAVIAATVAFAADPKPPDHKKTAIYTAAADLQWNPMDPSQPTGPAIAIANGDPKKGDVSMFMKVPAGFDSGWHIHKNWYVATVIKGTMTSQGQGDAAAKELPVGSFMAEPGNKNHRNTCTAAGECIIFGYMEKAHDFQPKTEDGKNPPKAAAAPKEEGKKADAPGQAKKEEAAPKK